MIQIVPATIADAAALAELAQQTFIESHGHSAPASEIESYLQLRLSKAAIEQELANPINCYHLLYIHQQLAGFSNIVTDCACAETTLYPVTKLDRIYILAAFAPYKAGGALFSFNQNLAKAAQQNGMWLYVWIHNAKAIRFYQKHHFSIIGNRDFKISANHANPNHIMLLDFSNSATLVA